MLILLDYIIIIALNKLLSFRILKVFIMRLIKFAIKIIFNLLVLLKLKKFKNIKN